MKERFTRKNTDFKARIEAKKPTPNQISNYVNAQVSENFEILEPYFQPTKHDIEQKKEAKKYGKR